MRGIVAAAAVLMDGSVALILDADDIVRSAERLLQPGERGAIEAPAATVAVATRKRVLVVDDSIAVREAQRQLLVNRGYLVDVAVDGVDGLNSARRVHYDLIISDIDMPRMNGFDLVRNMRADARLRELPVIMITSRIAQKHRDYAAELGVDHYLGKPYSEEDLLALISRYTSRIGATTVH